MQLQMSDIGGGQVAQAHGNGGRLGFRAGWNGRKKEN